MRACAHELGHNVGVVAMTFSNKINTTEKHHHVNVVVTIYSNKINNITEIGHNVAVVKRYFLT